MAIDQKIHAEPFRLFHGTTKIALRSILQQGLKPHMSKDQANRGNHNIDRKGVYLTNCYWLANDFAEVARDIRGGGDIVILEIDVSKIDMTALEPDDYDLQDCIDGGEEGQDGIDPRVAHLKNWSEASWQLSLAVTKEVVYSKLIPPSAIKVISSSLNPDQITPGLA